MTTHKLKTIQPYFEECWRQSKTFEVRKNDRDFQRGDEIYLQEYDPRDNTYSGREIKGTILYVLYEYPVVRKDHVVFSYSVEKYIDENEQV